MNSASIWKAAHSPRTLYLAMCLLWVCWPVAAQQAAPAGQASGEPMSQDGRGLMTLNFQNIDIRSLLQVMADFTGLNLVVSDSVTGTVTLRLKEVPWAQALNIILEAHGLGMRQVGNVLQIAPKTELAAREKTEIEAQQALQGLGPVRMQEFKLNYARAADVARSLTGSGAGANAPAGMRILSARGSVLADLRTNQVFVSDMPTRLVQVQDLIRKLDIPVRQVLIEARIVEASDNFGRSLGVRLGGRATSLNNNINTQAGAGYLSPAAGAATSQQTAFGVTAGDFVNLPAAA